jgi:hypothetical protein
MDQELEVAALVAVDAKELTEAQARKVTADIVKAVEETVPELLLKAYEGKAWKALGLDSWDAYVRANFTQSTANAWKGVQKAMAQRALTQVAGAKVEVSARAVTIIGARQLPGVIERARVVAEATPEAGRVEAVQDFIAQEAKEAPRGSGGQALRARNPNGPVQVRTMVPAFLKPLWPRVELAAERAGVEPEAWVTKALDGLLPALPAVAQAPAAKAKRTSRPRQSAGVAPQEADRDGSPDEGTAVEALTVEVVPDEPAGEGVEAGPEPEGRRTVPQAGNSPLG